MKCAILIIVSSVVQIDTEKPSQTNDIPSFKIGVSRRPYDEIRFSHFVVLLGGGGSGKLDAFDKNQFHENNRFSTRIERPLSVTSSCIKFSFEQRDEIVRRCFTVSNNICHAPQIAFNCDFNRRSHFFVLVSPLTSWIGCASRYSARLAS
jgi:hypothetical protein